MAAFRAHAERHSTLLLIAKRLRYCLLLQTIGGKQLGGVLFGGRRLEKVGASIDRNSFEGFPALWPGFVSGNGSVFARVLSKALSAKIRNCTCPIPNSLELFGNESGNGRP